MLSRRCLLARSSASASAIRSTPRPASASISSALARASDRLTGRGQAPRVCFRFGPPFTRFSYIQTALPLADRRNRSPRRSVSETSSRPASGGVKLLRNRSVSLIFMFWGTCGGQNCLDFGGRSWTTVDNIYQGSKGICALIHSINGMMVDACGRYRMLMEVNGNREVNGIIIRVSGVQVPPPLPKIFGLNRKFRIRPTFQPTMQCCWVFAASPFVKNYLGGLQAFAAARMEACSADKVNFRCGGTNGCFVSPDRSLFYASAIQTATAARITPKVILTRRALSPPRKRMASQSPAAVQSKKAHRLFNVKTVVMTSTNCH